VGEVVIQQWSKAGLLKVSVIKPILTTIEKSLVIRHLGRLEDDDLAALGANLRFVLG
jgi:mRNA interferase MazF